MSQRRTRTVRGAVSLVVVVGSLSVTGAVQATASLAPAPHADPVSVATQVQAPVPRIAWRSCGDGSGLRCATVEVPLDYDEPDGEEISLALAKRPADDKSERIGTLFINPGGPGGSAVRYVGIAAPLLAEVVRQRFDIVGIDPRGVGGSTPLVCKTQPGDPEPPPPPNQFFPIGTKQVANWLAYDEVVRHLCATGGNAILDHMSTADTARDMDLIRQAVGDPMLTYYGVSYGTQLGTTYAAMFPSRVRAMVLDSVLDPVQWTSGRAGQGQRYLVTARIGSGTGAWEALTSAFAECDRVGRRLCDGAGRVGHEWTKVITKLKTGPAHLGGSRITYANVIGRILFLLYNRSGYPVIMRYVHSLYVLLFSSGATQRTAVERARLDLTRSSTQTGAPPPRYLSTTRLVAPAGSLSPTFNAVTCADSVNPGDEAAAVVSAHYANLRGPWFGPAWSWIGSLCIGWPGSSDDAFQGPWRTATANPIVLTGTLHDPATPFSGARAVNRLFPGSRLITLSSWGHGAIGESRCLTSKWARYFVSLRLPASGLVCQPDDPLFPG